MFLDQIRTNLTIKGRIDVFESNSPPIQLEKGKIIREQSAGMFGNVRVFKEFSEQWSAMRYFNETPVMQKYELTSSLYESHNMFVRYIMSFVQKMRIKIFLLIYITYIFIHLHHWFHSCKEYRM